jgi:hypothetical protein
MTTMRFKNLLCLFIKPVLLMFVVCYSVVAYAQLSTYVPMAQNGMDNTTAWVSKDIPSVNAKSQFIGSSDVFIDNTRMANPVTDTVKAPSKTEQSGISLSLTPAGTLSLVEDNMPPLVLSQTSDELKSDITSAELIECHCFGKVTGDCYSTGALGANYSLPCKTQAHQNDCCGRVKNAIAALSAAQKQTILDCLCSKNTPDNTDIYATAAVATSDYEKCDGAIGKFHQKPAYSITTCTCPAGWLANPTNVDGGVTSDGKCKKGVCGPWNDVAFSHPPNGTPVGTWGFTWENGLYTWGTTANGGAAKCVTVNYPKGPCTMTW